MHSKAIDFSIKYQRERLCEMKKWYLIVWTSVECTCMRILRFDRIYLEGESVKFLFYNIWSMYGTSSPRLVGPFEY